MGRQDKAEEAKVTEKEMIETLKKTYQTAGEAAARKQAGELAKRYGSWIVAENLVQKVLRS